MNSDLAAAIDEIKQIKNHCQDTGVISVVEFLLTNGAVFNHYHSWSISLSPSYRFECSLDGSENQNRKVKIVPIRERERDYFNAHYREVKFDDDWHAICFKRQQVLVVKVGMGQTARDLVISCLHEAAHLQRYGLRRAAAHHSQMLEEADIRDLEYALLLYFGGEQFEHILEEAVERVIPSMKRGLDFYPLGAEASRWISVMDQFLGPAEDEDSREFRHGMFREQVNLAVVRKHFSAQYQAYRVSLMSALRRAILR